MTRIFEIGSTATVATAFRDFRRFFVLTNFVVGVVTAVAAFFPGRLSACDFCSCELPNMGLGNHLGWNVRVSEQFTHFGTLLQDGERIANPAGERLESSVTQIIIGYDFAHALSVQLSVPLVERSFQRWRNGVLERGQVGGVGDVSFLAHWATIHLVRSDYLASMRFFAGVSLPTGDSRRVLEEGAEADSAGAEGEGGATLASGIHGHDLALGTGSVSGIFGWDARVQWKRLFATAGIEGTARTRGAHGYTFADEMSWRGEVGGFLVDGDDFNLALSAECTGASKGEDVFQGTRATDTAATFVFLGPKIAVNWRKRYHADVAVDFPGARENSGVQAVPDYRISATVGIRF